MSEGRIVPIAYVTKWATTVGIRVVRNGAVTSLGALMTSAFYVPRQHWTDSKVTAEERYRSAIESARRSAERKVKALEALINAAPKYTED